MTSISPILIDFPESFETERLCIRAPQWGDGIQVNEAIHESIAELKPWLPFAKTLPTLEESESNARQHRLNFLACTDMILYITDKHTGDFIGSSGLHQIDWDARKFEIGYWLRTSCTGKGYMTEAVTGIAQFAIDHLQANRIEIRCDDRNTSSSQVAIRTGFTLEGTLRNHKMNDGQWVSTMTFAKVRGIEY